jgi:hypothetical protein
MHLLDRLSFELITLELVPWLSALLEDFNCYTLVLELVVINLCPVNLGILCGRSVYDSELGLVANLFHLPLNETLVVVRKGCLIE